MYNYVFTWYMSIFVCIFESGHRSCVVQSPQSRLGASTTICARNPAPGPLWHDYSFQKQCSHACWSPCTGTWGVRPERNPSAAPVHQCITGEIENICELHQPTKLGWRGVEVQQDFLCSAVGRRARCRRSAVMACRPAKCACQKSKYTPNENGAGGNRSWVL